MESFVTFENYPSRVVILSNLVSLSIYLSGFYISTQLSWIAAGIYLIFILYLEFRLLSRHCTNCYYWGRICGFGKGRISSLLFKKGNPAKFCEKNFTWKEMIPDLSVTLVPLLAAIILLLIRFNLVLLLAMIVLILSATAGNGFIRGKLTCKYCKQRELGCPAEQLFSKK